MTSRKTAPAAAPAAAPAQSVEALLAAIITATAQSAPRRVAAAARDPWSTLARPLTDKESAAVAKLAQTSAAAGGKGWISYSDSRDFYTPKMGAEIKYVEQIDLSKCAEKSRNGFLFNACVYSILQVKGQVYYGDLARLAVAFNVTTVKSAPLMATRFLSLTNCPIKWEAGWLRIDSKFTLPLMPNQEMYGQLAAAMLAA